MKKVFTLLTLLTLISCGNNARKEVKVDANAFPQEYISKAPAIKGGELKIAIVQDSPFTGIFSNSLATQSTDGYLAGPINSELFFTDGDFNYVDGGAMTMRYDVDKNVINLKLKKGMVWQDGAPVTMDDYIFVYKIIASPKYTGVRYTDAMRNVVGIDEYHAGKTDKISGLEKVNDYELNIHLKEASPFVQTLGGGLVSYLEPYHYLKDVPVDKLESSDKVRLKPLSWGPYKVDQIVPGESVSYVVNDKYYNKANMPKVNKLVYKILPSTSLVSSMKNGEFDVYKDISVDVYPEFKNFDNQVILGTQDLYYQYLGFNLGHWDDKKGINVVDKDKKLANLDLRKAIAYALDIKTVCNNFYFGLREKANSIIPPVFHKYYNSTPRYDYNPEKAKEILDKLGYKDVNGDGYREDPQGKPFEISLAFPSMGDIAEPLSSKFIQDWKAVGLNVKLATGRLINGAAYFPMIQSNKGYDMWVAAWSVGTNLDPSSLYGKTAKFNFSRAVEEKSEELINDILSLKSIKDPNYKLEKFLEWENNYMENVLGYLPLTFKYDLVPVNKRLKEWTLTNDSREAQKFIDGVTQDKGFASTK